MKPKKIKILRMIETIKSDLEKLKESEIENGINHKFSIRLLEQQLKYLEQ